MNDWATVAIALGPAGITGLVGYYAAKFARDSSKEETRAATERIRLEHAEAMRSHRQTVYHDFLTLLERHNLMMFGFAPRDQHLYEEWLDKFYAQYHGLHLFGAQGVRDALGALVDVLTAAGSEALGGAPEDQPLEVEHMVSVWPRHMEAFAEVTADLTIAMREDVAAGLPPPADLGALEDRRA
jgi:hypothetical protein